MRWMITGARGQLGSDLTATLSGTGAQVTAFGRDELDVTDSRAVDAAVARVAPDVVLNAAAYTAVDAAETDQDAAHLANAVAPALLAAAVARHGGRLVHVSTDYVFDGRARAPYDIDAPTAPGSAYGRTKRAGELAVLELLPDRGHVVRTAWVYGAVGGNFVKTMIRLEGAHRTVSVVDDQRGAPTWSADLARGLVELGGRPDVAPGVLHLTGGGDTTWFGLTQAIFTELGADPARVLPTTTDAFPRPAPRPAYSVLSDRAWRAAGLTPLPHWRAALGSAFATVGDALRAG